VHASGNGVSVRVQVLDLFDANGDYLEDWIHEDFIEIGTEPYGTFKTPISEAPKCEPGVWLESRGYRQDPENPGKSFPLSNFVSQAPKKMTVQTPGPTSACQNKSFIIFDLKTSYESANEGYTWRTSRVLPKDFSSDGVDWPAEGSFFTVTFEVRTDWKPHPFSWARLPLIGPFHDWDRANSWAMSISWVDASGQDRLKYLHCENSTRMLNKASMGSIQPYARGIEVRTPSWL
jgi:hypothetical protein